MLEMALFMLLIIPLPFTIKRKVFTYVNLFLSCFLRRDRNTTGGESAQEGGKHGSWSLLARWGLLRARLAARTKPQQMDSGQLWDSFRTVDWGNTTTLTFRFLLRFISENPIVAKIQYWMKICFVFILILFIDSVNRVYRVQTELAAVSDGANKNVYVFPSPLTLAGYYLPLFCRT
jgi:hypothetical protein